EVLGYAGEKRSAIAPDVPTIAEDGVPGFKVVSWYGFAVPIKTPTEIVMKMNADTNAALADPSVEGRLAPLGYESRSDPPEKVGAFLKAEVEIWSRVIRQAGSAPARGGGARPLPRPPRPEEKASRPPRRDPRTPS